MIADGRNADELIAIRVGENRGSVLVADVEPMVARKRWIAGQLRTKGTLKVDAGATEALKRYGVSLLAVGVEQVLGDFQRGDLVAIKGDDGVIFAQGFVNYSSVEAIKIMKTPSDQISTILGYIDEAELIHRENLALLGDRISV